CKQEIVAGEERCARRLDRKQEYDRNADRHRDDQSPRQVVHACRRKIERKARGRDRQQTERDEVVVAQRLRAVTIGEKGAKQQEMEKNDRAKRKSREEVKSATEPFDQQGRERGSEDEKPDQLDDPIVDDMIEARGRKRADEPEVLQVKAIQEVVRVAIEIEQR